MLQPGKQPARPSRIRKSILPVVLVSLLFWATTDAAAGKNETAGQSSETPVISECTIVVELLQEQKTRLSRELRSIKREIALLKLATEKPGIDDIFSGIGYILGIFGAAALIMARRSKRTGDQHRQ